MGEVVQAEDSTLLDVDGQIHFEQKANPEVCNLFGLNAATSPAQFEATYVDASHELQVLDEQP